MSKKFIDIEKILRERSPITLKLLPRFVINYLKRKLREDDINKGQEFCEKFHGLRYNEEILRFLNVNVDVVNKKNIPAAGGVIFASNHPLGGLDGLAFIKAVGEVRPDVRFIVNDILRNLKNFDEIFVGVNKMGGSSRDALKTIEDVYASPTAILIFPAGLVSRKTNKGIRDLEWSKSFITKALKYNKPVVPVFIEGQNRAFFYNLAKWRKRLGIKKNIEMFCLPDEMFRQSGKTIRIHFGKPILPSVFTNDLSEKEWALKLQHYVYSEDFKKEIPFSA